MTPPHEYSEESLNRLTAQDEKVRKSVDLCTGEKAFETDLNHTSPYIGDDGSTEALQNENTEELILRKQNNCLFDEGLGIRVHSPWSGAW